MSRHPRCFLYDRLSGINLGCHHLIHFEAPVYVETMHHHPNSDHAEVDDSHDHSPRYTAEKSSVMTTLSSIIHHHCGAPRLVW